MKSTGSVGFVLDIESVTGSCEAIYFEHQENSISYYFPLNADKYKFPQTPKPYEYVGIRSPTFLRVLNLLL